MTLKMVSTASLLGAQHLGKVVENKPASSLLVFLGKALIGMPHVYMEDRWPRRFKNECGRPVENIAIQFTFS